MTRAATLKRTEYVMHGSRRGASLGRAVRRANRRRFLVKRTVAQGAVALAGLAMASSAHAATLTNLAFGPVSARVVDAQAGAHSDFTTSFRIAFDPAGNPYAAPQTISVELPPGMVGNPQAFPKCSVAALSAGINRGCPFDSQVGFLRAFLYTETNSIRQPVYNMELTSREEVARLGFFAGVIPSIISVRLDAAHGYRLVATVVNTDAALIVGADTTLWGVPADPIHDDERITPLEGNYGCAGSCPSRASALPRIAFMTNPTRCTASEVVFTQTTFTAFDLLATATAPLDANTGCSRVPFNPVMAASPQTRTAASPTGLDVDLQIPQSDAPDSLAQAQLRRAIVTLPRGMSINPAAADGLGACSADEVAFQTDSPAACPDASQIGSFDVDSPALPGLLTGAIYQRTPEPGHLFRIWLAADGFGVHLKLPGEINLDPTTGQLQTVFDDNPQLPFSDLKLHFKGGSRGVLVTPPTCGTSKIHSSLTPWSSDTPVESDSSFAIDQNCSTGAFAPKLTAGLTNAQAGGSSSFALQLTRQDGELNVSSLDTTLPAGLLADIAGVTRCSDSDVAADSCAAASQVGRTVVSTGAGSTPLYLPQPGKSPTAVYLAGPYKGAPFSLLIRVPAQAGPFDLGTVAVRAALAIDPEDAHVTVKADPLPQIIQGIPLNYREIRVIVDRPGFMQAPTNCGAKEIRADVTPAAQDPQNAIDGSGIGFATQTAAVAHLTTPFAVANCAALPFSPKLAMSLTGKTQVKPGKHPDLAAMLTQPAGQANLQAVQVALPLSLALDPDNSQVVCSVSDAAALSCPAKTQVGTAVADTPLLPNPLSGPVYLVQGLRTTASGRQVKTLPKLLVPLSGRDGVNLNLHAASTVSRGKLVTTFDRIPDAPVARFVLKISGGKKGILVVTGKKTLCKQSNVAAAVETAQSGRTLSQSVRIGRPCSGKASRGRSRRAAPFASTDG